MFRAFAFVPPQAHSSLLRVQSLLLSPLEKVLEVQACTHRAGFSIVSSSCVDLTLSLFKVCVFILPDPFSLSLCAGHGRSICCVPVSSVPLAPSCGGCRQCCSSVTAMFRHSQALDCWHCWKESICITHMYLCACAAGAQIQDLENARQVPNRVPSPLVLSPAGLELTGVLPPLQPTGFSLRACLM